MAFKSYNEYLRQFIVVYTTNDLVGVWRSKNGNSNFDCRAKSDTILECNNKALYQITVEEKNGKTVLTSWLESIGTFDGKAAITWKTRKNAKIVWHREGMMY